MAAAERGQWVVVAVLLDSGCAIDLRHCAKKTGHTALTVAAGEGNFAVVDMLLRAGAGVNITKGMSGRTALE